MSARQSMENAMSHPSRIARLALLLSLYCIATGAAALIQRTFVASGGSDVNPCTLASPCRSFGAAIAQTSSGGEVIVLDSAGYGPVVISQAVSIIAPTGVYAGVTVMSGAGITVNAGAGTVTLRGLTINSLGGTIGIDYQSGAKLYVDNTIVTGFAGSPTAAGIRAVLAVSGNLNVRNSAFRDNGAGVRASAITGTVNLDIERSAFERNFLGLDLVDNTAGVIRNSTFTAGSFGIAAEPTTAGKTSRIEIRQSLLADNSVGLLAGAVGTSATYVSLINSLVTGNTTGVQATANPVYCSDNTITRNGTGLSLVTGGTGLTALDNAVVNNGASNAFTTVVPKL
jgi:hypothetical protein